MFHATIETDIVKCPHNGVVTLKGHPKWRYHGIPVVTDVTMKGNSIVGCMGPEFDYKNVCTSVASASEATTNYGYIRGQRVVLQEKMSNAVSDKGFSLIYESVNASKTRFKN